MIMDKKKINVKKIMNKIANARDVALVPTSVSLVITGQILTSVGTLLQKSGFKVATLAKDENIRHDAKECVKGLNEVIEKSKKIADEVNAKYAPKNMEK